LASFQEKNKEKHKLKMKMIEDHYNRIVAMNERSTHVILELNIRERQNSKKSLEHEVGKLQNLNKESYKGMIIAWKDVNSKLDAKIRKGNDEVISYFSHIMMEIVNKIFK